MATREIAKTLMGLSIIATVIIVALADVFNATHLFNPAWPGHAKFHIAMQFTTLLLISGFSLYSLQRNHAFLAALAPLTFWPGLLVAYVIPGTDVYATEELRQLGVPINLVLAIIFIALTFTAYAMMKNSAKQQAQF